MVIKEIFDRTAITQHHFRAANQLSKHDFLFRESASQVVERIDDIDRDFALAVDMNRRSSSATDILRTLSCVQKWVVTCEALNTFSSNADIFKSSHVNELTVIADEEFLPLGQGKVDLVVSILSLHWANDLPGTLIQIRRALKSSGLFIGVLLGGETLTELRQALVQAECEVEGGASPRVSPFIDVAQAGDLLARAGFSLPVSDIDTLAVTYPDALSLMNDLQGMGETNAATNRRRTFSRRSTLSKASAIYADQFGTNDGRVKATFQIIYMAGWASDTSQPKPLSPGRKIVAE